MVLVTYWTDQKADEFETRPARHPTATDTSDPPQKGTSSDYALLVDVSAF